MYNKIFLAQKRLESGKIAAKGMSETMRREIEKPMNA